MSTLLQMLRVFCLGRHSCAYTIGQCEGQRTNSCPTLNSQESVLAFYLVVYGAQTQVVRLAHKHLYLLSHPAGLEMNRQKRVICVVYIYSLPITLFACFKAHRKSWQTFPEEKLHYHRSTLNVFRFILF